MKVTQENKASELICLSCSKKFYEFETIKHILFSFHTKYVDKEGILYTFSFNFGYCVYLIKRAFGMPKRGFIFVFNNIRKIGGLSKKSKKNSFSKK